MYKNSTDFFEAVYLRLLVLEAKIIRRRTGVKIVAVVGSVGKTSTRDAIHTILSQSYTSRRNRKNLNLIMGVSSVVVGVPMKSGFWQHCCNLWKGVCVLTFPKNYPDVLVLEVGMTKKNDMQKFMWLRPDVLVYTRFPDVPVHIEYFDSPEDVTAEKLRMKEVLHPEGVLVLNADDPKMAKLHIQKNQRLYTYGMQNSADVHGTNPTIEYTNGMPSGVSATVTYKEERVKFLLQGTVGTHHMYPILAALAVAMSEGVSFGDAIKSMSSHIGPRSRMRLLKGIHGTLLIDDTYNASPAALQAGIETVQQLDIEGRKILVLGDMLELGEFTKQEHERVGEQITHECDTLLVVGEHMKVAANIVKQRGTLKVIICNSTTDATNKLLDIMRQNDAIYIKGSGSMRMERIVKELMVDKERAPTLIVRQ